MDSRIRRAADELVARLPGHVAGRPSRREVAVSRARVAARKAADSVNSRTTVVAGAGAAIAGGAAAYLARRARTDEVPEGVSPGVVPAKDSGADTSAAEAQSPPITAVNP